MMTGEQLKKANEINNEIDRIDHFIKMSERHSDWLEVFHRREFKLKSNLRFRTTRDSELRLSNELSTKVLDVLKDERERLSKELSEV